MCDCHKHEKRCCKKKCVKKYVIKSLPYVIDKPGQYCLCKDFTWTLNETNSGITVLNTENVVLDFKQKKITVVKPDPIPDPEPVYLPTVLAQNSIDVVFQNVHLEAVDAAVNTAPGLHIFDCANVNVRSPYFINMGEFFDNAALRVSTSSDVNVSKLILENFTSGLFHYGIVFDNVNKFTMTEAQVLGSVVYFTNSKNGDILRCQVNNLEADNLNRGIVIESDNVEPGIISSNIRVAECNIRVKDWYGIWVADFGEPVFEPEFASQNIVIENNAILADEGGSPFPGTGIYLQITSDVVVRNNKIQVSGEANPDFGATAAISIYDSSRCAVENNSVTCVKGAQLGIEIFGDDTLPSISSANTIRGNVVNCFDVGYTESNVAECTLFSNNIANGNVSNYLINTADPVKSVRINNIEGCNKPLPPATEPEPQLKVKSKPRKREPVPKRERK